MLKEVVFNRIKFRLAQGDITKYGAEAIVNAANKYLVHGGGVALAIARAAANNPEEYTRISKEEMKKQIGRDYIEHGEVVVTPPLSLEKTGTRYVIHTVGPICKKWDDKVKEKLRKALIAPLRKAEEMELKSIAFPAVSAGIYGCPLEEVVKTLLEVVEEFSRTAKSLRSISLVLYDERAANKALKVLTKH